MVSQQPYGNSRVDWAPSFGEDERINHARHRGFVSSGIFFIDADDLSTASVSRLTTLVRKESGTSSKCGRKIQLVALPSPSPANQNITYPVKRERYGQLCFVREYQHLMGILSGQKEGRKDAKRLKSKHKIKC